MEKWNKICTEKNCDGEVDFDKPIPLQTSEDAYTPSYVCKKCGALYWYNGIRIKNVLSITKEKVFI